MPSISKWTIDLQTNTASFRKGLKGARRSAKRFGASINSLLRGPLTKLGAALAGFVAIRGLHRMVAEQMRLMETTMKMADRLGIAASELSKLEHAADMTGVATTQLHMGLQRMTRRIAEAAVGTGEAQVALKDLRVSAKALASLSPDKQFRAIAKAMETVSTQGERIRLTFKLFDSEGVSLINTLRLGAKGLDDLGKDAVALGIVMDRRMIEEIIQAGDALKQLKKASGGLALTLTSQLAPIIKIAADWLTDMKIASRGAAVGMTSLFERVVVGAVFAANAVQGLTTRFMKLQLASAKAMSFIAKSKAGKAGAKFAGELKGVFGEAILGTKTGDIGRQQDAARGMKSFGQNYIEELDRTIKGLEKKVMVMESANWGKRAGDVLKDMREQMRQAAADAAAAAKGIGGGMPALAGIPARPGTFMQIVRAHSALGQARSPTPGAKVQQVSDPLLLAVQKQILVALGNLIPIMGP